MSKEQPDCWYCGTSVRREIRPERRCPYCDEKVRPKAIKCANCGEFLDEVAEVEKEAAGRERPATVSSGKPPEAAAPAPRPREQRTIAADAKPALEHKTRLKLEAPTRFRTGGEHRDPDAAATAESMAVPESILKGRAKPKDLIRIEQRERELATVEVELEPARAPAKLDPNRTLPAIVESGPGASGEGGAGWFGRFAGLFRGAPPPPPPRVDLREHSAFRNCSICGTEIFASDNYCFHCGQKYAAREFRFDTRVYGPLNYGVYATTAVLLIPHVLYFIVANKPPRGVLLGSAAAAVGLCLFSLVKSPDRRNRIVSGLLLAMTIALTGVPLFLTYGPR